MPREGAAAVVASSSAPAAPASRQVSGSRPRSCGSGSRPAFRPRWLRVAKLLRRLTRARSRLPPFAPRARPSSRSWGSQSASVPTGLEFRATQVSRPRRSPCSRRPTGIRNLPVVDASGSIVVAAPVSRPGRRLWREHNSLLGGWSSTWLLLSRLSKAARSAITTPVGPTTPTVHESGEEQDAPRHTGAQFCFGHWTSQLAQLGRPSDRRREYLLPSPGVVLVSHAIEIVVREIGLCLAQGYGTMARRVASAASSARVVIPSLAKMWDRCTLTVPREMNIRSPI